MSLPSYADMRRLLAELPPPPPPEDQRRLYSTEDTYRWCATYAADEDEPLTKTTLAFHRDGAAEAAARMLGLGIPWYFDPKVAPKTVLMTDGNLEVIATVTLDPDGKTALVVKHDAAGVRRRFVPSIPPPPPAPSYTAPRTETP